MHAEGRSSEDLWSEGLCTEGLWSEGLLSAEPRRRENFFEKWRKSYSQNIRNSYPRVRFLTLDFHFSGKSGIRALFEGISMKFLRQSAFSDFWAHHRVLRSQTSRPPRPALEKFPEFGRNLDSWDKTLACSGLCYNFLASNLPKKAPSCHFL